MKSTVNAEVILLFCVRFSCAIFKFDCFLFQSSNVPFQFSHFILIYNTRLNKKNRYTITTFFHKFNVPKQLKYKLKCCLCVWKCYCKLNVNLVHMKC